MQPMASPTYCDTIVMHHVSGLAMQHAVLELCPAGCRGFFERLADGARGTATSVKKVVKGARQLACQVEHEVQQACRQRPTRLQQQQLQLQQGWHTCSMKGVAGVAEAPLGPATDRL